MNVTFNRDVLAGKWTQVRGQVKQMWGKLTDDDLTVAAGQREQFLGVLQQRYGYQKEKAEKELDEFIRALRE